MTPSRIAQVQSRIERGGRLTRPVALLILIVGLGAFAPYLVQGAYTMRLLDLALIYSIYSLSLNLVLGYAGLINLGQSAFLGLGAYSTAVIAVRTGLPFWACLLASVLFGVVAGVVVGVPSLRIGGHYLAVVTLGFGQIAFVVFVNFRDITGGYDGLGGIPSPQIGSFVMDNVFTFYYLPFVLLLLVAGGMHLVRRSHLGRVMLSLREDETMARSLGVRVIRVKTYAFVACSCLASLAGGLYAYLFGYISPDSFTLNDSVLVLAMVLLGGRGSIPGVIAGAFLLILLPEYLRFLGDWYPVVYGAVIIAVMLFAPGGLAEMVSVARRRLHRRVA